MRIWTAIKFMRISDVPLIIGQGLIVLTFTITVAGMPAAE